MREFESQEEAVAYKRRQEKRLKSVVRRFKSVWDRLPEPKRPFADVLRDWFVAGLKRPGAWARFRAGLDRKVKALDKRKFYLWGGADGAK